MSDRNIVNLIPSSDKNLILNSCTRTNIERDKGLFVLRKTFDKKSPIYDVNSTFEDEGIWTPLTFAVFFERREEVEVLLKLNANPNVVLDSGFTPLHICVNSGNYKIFQLLHVFGADINCSSSKGVTPLMLACENGHEKIVKTLLDLNADLTKTDKHGDTCLQYAIKSEHHNIINMINFNKLNEELESNSNVIKRIIKI